jgi:hypothetical protein
LFFEKQENTLQFMSKQWNQSYLQVVALQKICTLLKLKKKLKEHKIEDHPILGIYSNARKQKWAQNSHKAEVLTLR